jgi:hypothetical protein
MKIQRLCSIALVLLGTTGFALAQQSPAADFIPDTIFSGSSLSGWHTVGQAQWKAQNGEITGVGAPGGKGGWLMLDKSYQDVQFFSQFQCTGECKTGVLVRAEKTPTGYKGQFVSLSPEDLSSYQVTLDAQGNEVSRKQGRVFTAMARVVPAEREGRGALPGAETALTPTPEAAAAAKERNGGVLPPGGRPGFPPPVEIPSLEPQPTGIRQGWNEIEVVMDANILRPYLNNANGIPPRDSGDEGDGYGQVALYVGPGAQVTFKNVAFKDLNLQTIPAAYESSRFREQQLDQYYYAWGADAGDINRDGITDVVAGPYYYLGPDYLKRREIYLGNTFSPGAQFTNNMVCYVSDFTGDGWPDALIGQGRPMNLYVNPKGENRRWEKYAVLPQIDSEIALMYDVDGDGKPEIVFGSKATLYYGKPDPANPTGPWVTHQISEPGYGYGHGMGVGDINGDGRPDVIQAAGWWEQPPHGDNGLWKYHKYGFGRWARSEGAGGALMGVYDINGDGLNDVIGGLNAHGFGLAWFEQKRDAKGEITFVRHMIIDSFATKNAGNVTMTEMHAAEVADIDGDGIPDFITGKRSLSHLNSYTDAYPFGPAVLYWFRTVRDPKAPGGARFVPELINNRSGVGSQFAVVDLNKDGRPDIVTSTNRGTFIFFNTGKAPEAPAPNPMSRK